MRAKQVRCQELSHVHSDDLWEIYNGEETATYLCGYHATKNQRRD